MPKSCRLMSLSSAIAQHHLPSLPNANCAETYRSRKPLDQEFKGACRNDNYIPILDGNIFGIPREYRIVIDLNHFPLGLSAVAINLDIRMFRLVSKPFC